MWVSQGKAQSNDAKLRETLLQDPFFGLPVDYSITLEYLRPGHQSSDLLFVTPRTLLDGKMFHNIRPIVGFYTDGGDEAAQRIPGRRIPVYSNHESNIKQFEAWIQESFDNTESAFGNGHDLTKRVFDVSEIEDSGAVSLKEFDAPTQGRYIALSHCWGKSLPVKTTTENIQEHRRSIRLNKLTPTFRDAIFLSHRFGVQYLWIDSLCILQDSKEDWETEAAKMGDYYRLSWLTIASGMSGDGLKDCFAARESPSTPYCALSTPFRESKRLCTLYFILDPPVRGSNSGELTLDKAPLHKRGWTFQEMVLAPRYLSFEPTEVYFRCDEFTVFETGRRVKIFDAYSPENKFLLERRMWMSIVSHYSSRDLTFETDKLPALSGLAHQYQRMWNDTYYARLWKSNLCQDLMWFLSSENGYHTKPSSYRAPSWSWASVNGVISYQAPFNTGASCVDLRRAFVKPKGLDPMGEVAFGVLVLFAHVQYLSTQNGQSWEEILRSNVGGFGNPTFVILDFRQLEDMKELWLVYITEGEGLALIRANTNKETYERIGIFRKSNVEGLRRYWRENGNVRRDIWII